MAFNTAEGRAEYSASSGQTLFTFNFKIYKTSDIEVYLTPAGTTPDDTTDILTETIDYTVSIDGDNGGSVTLVTPATLNDSVTFVRVLPNTRDTEYQSLGDLYADTLNMDQNYQTYLLKDRETTANRHISIPKSAQGVSTQLPDVNSDSYLKWNSAGDALENDSTVPAAVIAAGDSNLEAESWANENEDVPVKEYTAGIGSNITPAAYSAKHWAIKAQDAVIGDVEFRDTEWRVFDDIDNTKKIAFQVSGVSAATTRVITMPDADVDLGAIPDPTVLLHTVGNGGGNPEGYITTETAKLDTAGEALVKSTGANIQNQCTAWVLFNGSAVTITDSFNVSSVVRSAAGLFEINFAEAMDDTNFVMSAMARHDANTGPCIVGQSSQNAASTVNTAYIKVIVANTTTSYDSTEIRVAFFGGKA